jgi:DNA-directed RNA polymerase beta' subunit
MNMHVPQSVVSMIEISELAGVPTQIISPRECSPILSIEQDVALGVYRMTKKHVTVSEKQLFNMLCGNTNFIGQVPRPVFEKGVIKKWSGRQLLSTIIPKNVNISMPNSSYDKDEVDINDDNYVRIENGEILGGTIDKTIYQKGTFGLVHSIFNEYDPMEAKKFFDNTQTLVCDWLVQSGFSVGISDLIVDDSANNAMKSAIEKMKEQVYDIIANVHANKFENTSIKNNRDYFEDKVQGILSKATDEAAKIGMGKINDIDNRMLNMIKSKSKGKITNVGQMIACLGQNSDEGKRIPYGFENRTLPHFNKYDDGPESRGFVENSFVSGLSPHEFFFHAIGGRGGLIDTAVKTSDVGYLQRKLVKAMEDCKVNHDYTVRNASGSIIQFVYGEDGMDPTKIEDQPLPFTKMDYSKLKKAYLLTEQDNLKYVLEDDVIEGLHSIKDWQKKFEIHFQEIMTDREFVMKNILVKEGGNKIKYPIAFARITTNAKAMFNKYDNGALSDLDPIYALNTINKLCDELYVHEFNKANKFLKMLIRCYLSPKKCIFDYKFDRTAFDYVINQVRQRFYDSIAHPSDMVGVVAAQSLGEPCTQLTLNSVEWNTPMLFSINNNLQKVSIGEFIDNYINKANEVDIEKHQNDTTLAWVKDMDIKVMSCDKHGKVSWDKVEAVTQHPPINKDGSNTLLKIITRSGREVIATKAKSFLKRVNNEIVQINGDELNVGDKLPISKVFKLPMSNTRNTLDISTYLPKTQWLYMSEVEKARPYQQTHRHWYKEFNGNEFTLPYSRSDGYLETFVKNKTKQVYEPGCVYPKKTTRTTNKIPEHIQLTKEFGFLVGAYLSEGCTTNNHVLIANVDDNFLAKIKSICANWNVGYHMDKRYINGGVSQTMRMHSTILAKLFDNMLGNGSSNKHIPAWALQANDDFVKGLLDGYFSGDGTITKMSGAGRRNVVSATSTSKELIEDIQQLLLRYDIVSTICIHDTPKYEGEKGKFKTVQTAYKISITCGNTQRFATNVKLTLDAKQERLNCAKDINILYEYGKFDIIPEVITKQHGSIVIHRDELQKYIETCDNDDDLEIYSKILEEDIMYDEIVKIEEVVSEHPFVYDLTVENTRNFNIYNGLCMADTFHLSGVASASKAVRGVPRIKELMSVTKNIKTPSMSIRLKEQFAQDDKKSTEVLNNIQTTYFKDLVQSTKVYYDPDDFDTTIEDDRLFVETYKELTNEGLLQKTKLYPWLLRFELDRSAMVEHAVTMLDIYRVLNEYYEDMVHVMFSDDNSKNLIFRIKIEDQGEDKDIITEMKALERSMLDNVIIKGLPKISKVVKNQVPIAKYVPSTMTIESEQQWVLETAGTNMLDVMSMKEVDTTKTISNDIVEIYELLGVEAARQALYNELQSVIGDAGLYVNYRHIALLVDTMTNKGYLLSIDRHGINRTDIGPFAKCSFEETTDMLIKAGIFAEVDKINGVSANTMLGQVPPAGTGDTDVLIDEWKLQDITAEQEATQQDILQAYDVQQELEEEANLDFDFEMPI